MHLCMCNLHVTHECNSKIWLYLNSNINHEHPMMHMMSNHAVAVRVFNISTYVGLRFAGALNEVIL